LNSMKIPWKFTQCFGRQSIPNNIQIILFNQSLYNLQLGCFVQTCCNNHFLFSPHCVSIRTTFSQSLSSSKATLSSHSRSSSSFLSVEQLSSRNARNTKGNKGDTRLVPYLAIVLDIRPLGVEDAPYP
jgi:hypothetical protein